MLKQRNYARFLQIKEKYVKKEQITVHTSAFIWQKETEIAKTKVKNARKREIKRK